MGFWWRLRQWVYARPPVALAGAVLVFLMVGFSGWESARWFSDDGAVRAADTGPHQVAAAKTIRIKGKDGRVINHVVRRTRTVTTPGLPDTVVVTKDVTRVAPTVLVRKGTKTVTDVRTRTQTVVKNHTVTQIINNTQTTQTQALAAQDEGRTQTPPGHADTVAKGRSTDTVTVTQTQTQAAVTVTVTTSKGH